MQKDRVYREHWVSQIEAAWLKKSIIWFSGVRRAGKTCLCQSLDNVEYYDCELPRIRQLLEDPENFLHETRGKRIVLDEIHRLSNPTELLKIAADHYSETHIIATGSSTLGASAKFKDTLAGRKMNIWLTPMLAQESASFGDENLPYRFLRGGLPPFFLSDSLPEAFYQEWIDSFWAKDIQELFRLEKRYSFQKFTELLLAQSGSIFVATHFATPCASSHTTISNYLAVLEATFVAHVIRPFNTHRPSEIISAPKVFGFDTGFVCFSRGWLNLRNEDLGQLWEHLVLNELHGQLQTRDIRYWRDKQDHEIDFVIASSRNQHPIAIECKWKAASFDPKNLLLFRRHYPEGRNFVVAPDIVHPFTRKMDHVEIHFVNLLALIEQLAVSR